jgi:hypothetical protein
LTEEKSDLEEERARIWKRGRCDPIWTKNKEKLKSTACCIFGCFAGHRRRRETEKRKTFPIHSFAFFKLFNVIFVLFLNFYNL